MSAYYNEIDPYAAQWLRNLIAAGLIAAGEVDERSIAEVAPDDLRGFTRCHFFAGIAGWDLALQFAGWPDDRPVWTGSCPCQPFSSAGERRGFGDPRDLWPHLHRLIGECRPPIVFGEQVESPDGRLWLSRARTDVEGMAYAFGAVDLCAAGVGSPQRRQRLYWLADANGSDKDEWPSGRQQPVHDGDGQDSEVMGRAESKQRNRGRTARHRGPKPANAGSPAQAWAWWEIAVCDDGERRIEPGAQPLVDGVPGRLDMLRGYGNAIVPQVAAEFIAAYLECRP